MKKIDIIYSHTLKGIEGVNFVNNSFVEGNKYFRQNGLILSKIFSPYEIFDCMGQNRLNLIGSDSHLNSYKRIRKLRLFLKYIFSSNYSLGAGIKFYINYILPSRRVVRKYIKYNSDASFIIFQSVFAAYFYLKKCKNKKKKTILILHCSYDPFEQLAGDLVGIFSNSWFRNWIYSILNFVFYRIDKVVYLSQRAVDNSTQTLNKKTYIFNGEEDIIDHRFTDIHNPINLVSVGSLAWHKGQEYVIEAISKLPKDILLRIKYHLIGDGPQLSELQNAVIKHNLSKNVVFYGNRNDVAELLRQMDVFILPSKSEGLPMSIIEALRQGMYIVATDTGAIPEMITEGCGELIERDAQNIADCLTRIIKEDKVTIAVKKKARVHYLKNFTLENMIQKYCDLLKSL